MGKPNISNAADTAALGMHKSSIPPKVFDPSLCAAVVHSRSFFLLTKSRQIALLAASTQTKLSLAEKAVCINALKKAFSAAGIFFEK